MKQWFYSSYIYLKDEIFDGSMAIEDGKIVAFEKGIHEGAKRYDDKRIIPGIIDTHNHGSYGWSMMEHTSKESVQNFLKAVASQGVTTVFPTTFPSPGEIGVEGIIDAMNDEIVGAQIGGIHFEGPYLHRVGEKGVPVPKIDIDLNVVKEIIDACEGHLKVMGHAPELENSTQMIQLLLDHNVKAAITHTNADATIAKRAFDDGITVSTHTGNVMTGIHHRDVGTLGMVLIDDRIMCEVICDGMHLSLDMVKLIYKTVGANRMMMISDCTELSGLKPGTYGEIIVSADGFVKTKAGRLVGSSQPVLKGIQNLVEELHIPLTEVLKMSSFNQAKFYNLSNKGYLDLHMDADFVVIDDDYKVVDTYVLGHNVYTQGNQILFNEIKMS